MNGSHLIPLLAPFLHPAWRDSRVYATGLQEAQSTGKSVPDRLAPGVIIAA